MKKKFFEYYKPSEKDFESLWKKCLFVFDTSVLINLYEFSPKVRDEFLEILKKNSDRIWIPHQVAKEYQNRRPFAIREQRAIHQQLRNEFIETQEKINQNIEKSIQYHPFIDKNQLEEEIKKLFSNLIAYLKKCEENYPDLIKKDIVGEKIDYLFDGKVGDGCEDSELQTLFKTGAQRYAQKIPPGFADKEAKDNFKQYGDLILWQQIIRHSKSTKKSVIFVTNDQKPDWWFIYIRDKPFEKEILSPRPELIKEFFEKTQNQFFMYNPSGFMEAARKYLKQKVSDTAIKEVEDVSKKQETRDPRLKLGYDYFSEYNNKFDLPREIPEFLKITGYEPARDSSGNIFLRSTDNRNELPQDIIPGYNKVTGYGESPGSIFLRSTDNRDETRTYTTIIPETNSRLNFDEFFKIHNGIPQELRDLRVGSDLNFDRKYPAPQIAMSNPIFPKEDDTTVRKKPAPRKKSS
jgi:hypothetical protein